MTTRHSMPAHAVEALMRLANALDTSPEELMLHAPPSWTDDDPEDRGTLEVLDESECRRLLSSAVIGRIAFTTADGPAILPVTFAMSRGRPLFRTSPMSPLGRIAGERVAFEVDHTDPIRREGWSVVVTGIAHVAEGPGLANADGTAKVEPWPGGHRDLYVVVDPIRITGRRVARTAWR